MSDSRRRRLIKRGPEALADAILRHAERCDTANEIVERMIATPEENRKSFRRKIAGLKRSTRFVDWREADSLADKLEGLLDHLRTFVEDPREGTEFVAAFFRTDNATFERCDDSNGAVGSVYRWNAMKLFVEYALKCEDKDRLADLVVKLASENPDSVRGSLIDCAAEYLPEENIRTMITHFEELADREEDSYKKGDWLRFVGSLARQINDASLFERTMITSWGESSSACLDIASVYLESDDAESALAWLERMPTEKDHQIADRDRLLLAVYGRLGESEKQAQAAWRILRRSRSSGTLQDLLDVIGGEKRDEVIEGEVAAVLGKQQLSMTDAAFLIESGRLDDAETYLLDRAEQLDGDIYSSLIPLAKSMEAQDYPLVTSLLYRALLDSILKRAYTKAYSYGVRYLRKLDNLSKSITDWRNIDDHSAYMEHLLEKHGRKKSFWSRYDGDA